MCQDLQAAYRKSGRDPKDIPKTQFGLGLLPCDSSCKSRAQTVESELQQRKPSASEKKETENGPHVSKRRRRRERVQETTQVPMLQKLMTGLWRFVLAVILLVALVAVAYYGYKGLLALSDWMNEVEEHRERRKYRHI